MPSFEFAIAPVIEFKQKKIKNLLILSTAAKNKKRKMTEIVDTLMIKALQNFDTFTISNPLDIDIRSNYMTEKINSYKGHVDDDPLHEEVGDR